MDDFIAKEQITSDNFIGIYKIYDDDMMMEIIKFSIIILIFISPDPWETAI